MIIFLYVLREFFKYVIGTIFLCVFLFILFDFIHKSTKFFSVYQPSTEHLIQFYAYQIPGLLIQALPIASLLASVISMVLLSRTNEITAMRAAGMGPLRIGAPIAAGGIILSGFSVLVGEFVLPYSAAKGHYVKEVLIEKGKEAQISDGARWLKKDNKLYNFRDYDPISRIMDEVKMIEIGKSFRPRRSAEATRALYRESSDDWELIQVKILYFWPNGTLSYSEHLDSMVIKIPVEPGKLKKERRLPNELSSVELSEIIAKGETSGLDISSYKVDMHVKFAFHFASFVVCFIGLRFGYKSERSMETAKSVLLAILVGIGYWFVLNSFRALGKRGTLHPIIAAWAANVIIFSVAWFAIWRSRKN